MLNRADQSRPSLTDSLRDREEFSSRHLGPRDSQVPAMLETIGVSSLEELVNQTVPSHLRTERPLDLDPARSEVEALEDLRELSERNEVFRSFLGMGYHGCVTPPAIQT